MGTLRVDLDVLQELARTVSALGEAADGFKIGMGTAIRGDVMPSVRTAIEISNQIVDSSLIPAIKERLTETGEVMVNIATEYKDQDERNAELMVSAYRNAIGDWTAP
jgi:hypothetical protein